MACNIMCRFGWLTQFVIAILSRSASLIQAVRSIETTEVERAGSGYAVALFKGHSPAEHRVLGARQVDDQDYKGKAPQIAEGHPNVDTDSKHNCPSGWTHQGRYCGDVVSQPRSFSDLCTRRKAQVDEDSDDSDEDADKAGGVRAVQVEWYAAGSCARDLVCMPVVGPNRKDSVACVYLPLPHIPAAVVESLTSPWWEPTREPEPDLDFFALAELDIQRILAQPSAPKTNMRVPIKFRIDLASVTAVIGDRMLMSTVDQRSPMHSSRPGRKPGGDVPSNARPNIFGRSQGGQFRARAALQPPGSEQPAMIITRVGDTEPLCTTRPRKRRKRTGQSEASTSSGLDSEALNVCQPQASVPLNIGDQLDIALNLQDAAAIDSIFDLLLFDASKWPDGSSTHGFRGKEG